MTDTASRPPLPDHLSTDTRSPLALVVPNHAAAAVSLAWPELTLDVGGSGAPPARALRLP